MINIKLTLDKKSKTNFLNIFYLGFLFGLMFVNNAHSQDGEGKLDVIAPTISVDPVTETLPNKSLIISAKVLDEVGVGKVNFFYRHAKGEKYQQIEMTRGGEGSVYFANLRKDIVREPNIEYFIQASDHAGNSVLYGHSFSPKFIKVHSAANLKGSNIKLGSFDGKNRRSSEAKKGGMKWLWIGLGAVALGAAASSGGGGDSASADEGSTGTGSITVVAPVP